MTKLLIPTDFSNASLKALDYAIHWDRDSKSEITLMWVNNLGYKDGMDFSQETVKTEASIRLKQIIGDYLQRYSDLKINYVIRHGKVSTEVANQAKYNNIDYVICGTHGASGFRKDWIGNNAFELVSQCECPVITVRPNYRFESASDIIVVPIDSSLDSHQKIITASQIASMQNAHIHVLGLYTSKLSATKRKIDNHLIQIESYLNKANNNYQIIRKDAADITSSTLRYAESVDADMIMIMTEQESRVFRTIIGTYAKKIVNNSAIPVVSVSPNHTLKINEIL